MDNLIELIGSQVTPDVINAASGMLGASAEQTQSAANAGIPAIVGGLLQQGSTADGAAQLLGALSDDSIDPDMLGNIAGMLSGGGESADALTSMGGSMLSSLMGSNEDSVVDLISSVSGLDKGMSGTLMKVLVPMGAGVMRNVVKDQGLDAGGLMNMLMGQKDFLKASSPPGLTDALGVGSFDDFAMPDAAGAAGDAVEAATDAAGDAANAAADAAGDAANAVGDAVGDAADSAGDAAASATEKTVGAVETAASETKEAVEEVADKTVAAAEDAGQAAQQAAGGTPWWVWLIVVIVILALLWFFFS